MHLVRVALMSNRWFSDFNFQGYRFLVSAHRSLLELLTTPETGEGVVSTSFYPIPLVNRFVLFLLIGKALLSLTFLLSNLKQTYFLLCKNPLPPSGLERRQGRE
jgi:uncharacterized protein involved in cysteine biosynthesis